MGGREDRFARRKVIRAGTVPVLLFALALTGSMLVDVFHASSTSVAEAEADEKAECKKDDRDGECQYDEDTPPDDDGDDDDDRSPQPQEGDTWVETEYGNVCTGTPPDQPDDDLDCQNLHSCEEPGDLKYMEWQRTNTFRNGRWVHGDWESQGTVCRNPAEDDQVTEQDVLSELERFGLRPAVPEAQPPGGETLVNLKTIFYTEAEPYTFDLDLGPGVEIRATPDKFHWDFGDGDDLVTDETGRPYPHFDIYHQYASTGDVEVTLTVDYKVEWNPGGTGWNTIAETIPGQPSDPLQISVLENGSVLYE